MKTAICLLSVIPMRKEPSHRSEMVSQVLFGEYVTLGEAADDFVHVKCLYDGYEGWVQANQLRHVEQSGMVDTSYYTNGFTSLATLNGTTVHLPFATPVYGFDKLSFTISGSTINYIFQPQQAWDIRSLTFNETTLAAVYQPFLNTPYLWGGKSVFGIDCSGFAQQVFKLLGVKLLRDAYLQAEQGKPVSSVTEAKLGDLAFFQNEKGRVTHVGIVLNNQQIVHASGKVRIDTLDKEGIFNHEASKRTHTLHSIRRFF
jgi:gamma-D-glutamyl-L-lysine dipeptidyl-peptidase